MKIRVHRSLCAVTSQSVGSLRYTWIHLDGENYDEKLFFVIQKKARSINHTLTFDDETPVVVRLINQRILGKSCFLFEIRN